MSANITVEDRLLTEAQELGKHRTGRETVKAALREYVQRRKHLRILELFGKVDYDPSYNYKRERRAKRR